MLTKKVLYDRALRVLLVASINLRYVVAFQTHKHPRRP